MIGLIQAVDHFDTNRGLKFKSYAQHRILGAMLDFLRAEDPLSRGERRRIRESGMAMASPVTVSLDQLSVPVLNQLVATEDGTTAEMLRGLDALGSRRCLSARENRVITLLFGLGWRSRAVACAMKVNG